MRLPQMDASARGVGDGVGGGARGVARDEGAGAGAAGRVARRVLSVQHCVRARCARERRGEGVPPARGQAGVAAWGGNTAGATARWVRRTWERAAGRRSYLCALVEGAVVSGRERTQVAKKSRRGRWCVVPKEFPQEMRRYRPPQVALRWAAGVLQALPRVPVVLLSLSAGVRATAP